MFVFALSTQWSIFTFDITAACLHEFLDPNSELMYVWRMYGHQRSTSRFEISRGELNARSTDFARFQAIGDIILPKYFNIWFQTSYIRWKRILPHSSDGHQPCVRRRLSCLRQSTSCSRDSSEVVAKPLSLNKKVTKQ